MNQNITILEQKDYIISYDQDKINQDIIIKESLDFNYLILGQNSDISLNFITESENISANVFTIFYWKQKLSANIIAKIKNSNSKINVYILSFLQDNNSMDVQGSIDLWKNIHKAEWHLLEKNIILWKNIKIKAVPRLDVYSNDVKASHGVSIDRINKENLFYLKSKWLDENLSKELIIKWNITNILDHFKDLSDSQKNEIEQNILSEIKYHPNKGD